MRIGELATKAGVSVRALRYYEEHGLLTAERSGRGQRHYAEPAVHRVQLIQHLYAAGLTSRTIADLLPCVEAAALAAAYPPAPSAANQDSAESTLRIAPPPS